MGEALHGFEEGDQKTEPYVKSAIESNEVEHILGLQIVNCFEKHVDV